MNIVAKGQQCATLFMAVLFALNTTSLAAQSDKNNTILGTCSASSFCKLSGGIYLNAIYENNYLSILELDTKIYAQMFQWKKRFEKELGTTPLISNLMSRIIPKKSSMLSSLADNYMYNYKSRGAQCFQIGAQEKTFRNKSDTIIQESYYNGYYAGQTKFGGIESHATYKINPEFSTLLDKVGSSRSGIRPEETARSIGMNIALAVYEGFEQVQEKLDCNSAEIKQFERNLISLTERYLIKNSRSEEAKKTVLENIWENLATPQTPGQLSAQSFRPSPTKKPVNHNKIEIQKPSKSQQTHAEIAEQRRVQTATLAKKREALNKEIQEFQTKSMKAHEMKIKNFMTRLKHARSDKQRATIQQEIQAYRKSWMPKLKEKMEAIHERYQ